MNAIEDTPFSRGWAEIATRFPRPRAIVCVSAHWQTEGVALTGNVTQKTIHDFRGFPPALFAVKYAPPGAPELAQTLTRQLSAFDARVDETWGLDHGAWSVLKWLYPDADVPTIQLSLDLKRTPAEHYEIAQRLAPIRDDNVLIVGSGNIVHNLRTFRGPDVTPSSWDEQFEAAVLERVAANDHAPLFDYTTLTPRADLAAPDWEHYMPLLYVLGAQGAGEGVEVFNRNVVSGLAMTSLAIGLPEGRA